MKTKPVVRWGVRWNQENRLDGKTRFLIQERCLPVLFRTRSEAREWIELKYGNMFERNDLRDEPHGWRKPTAVRVTIMEPET